MDEHVLLRAEIENHAKRMETNEQLALIAAGAIWSWLATQKWEPAFTAVLCIPAGISLLLAGKWWALSCGIMSTAKYLRRIEAVLELEKYGWESHIEHEGRGWFTRYHIAFWSLLTLANIILAIVFLNLHKRLVS